MASKLRSIERARDQHEAKRAAKTGEMSVTIGELFNAGPALQGLTNERLSAPLAFRVSKISRAVTSELEACNETRLKLCEQYGTLNKDKSNYDFATDADREAFEKEWAQLIALPVTIKGEAIKVEDLRNVTISAASLLALSWLIVE